MIPVELAAPQSRAYACSVRWVGMSRLSASTPNCNDIIESDISTQEYDDRAVSERGLTDRPENGRL